MFNNTLNEKYYIKSFGKCLFDSNRDRRRYQNAFEI